MYYRSRFGQNHAKAWKGWGYSRFHHSVRKTKIRTLRTGCIFFLSIGVSIDRFQGHAKLGGTNQEDPL